MDEDREVAGIRCFEVLARLSAYLDGELGPAEVAQIQAHVAGCDTCARFGGRFGEAVRRLRAAGAEQRLDPAVAERLRARLGLP